MMQLRVKSYVNGTNVKEYTEEGLRNKIGIVPQKAVLFKGTIRSNLLWGKRVQQKMI